MTFKNILCRTIFYSMLFKNGFLTISRKLENSVTLFFGVNDETLKKKLGGPRLAGDLCGKTAYIGDEVQTRRVDGSQTFKCHWLKQQTGRQARILCLFPGSRLLRRPTWNPLIPWLIQVGLRKGIDNCNVPCHSPSPTPGDQGQTIRPLPIIPEQTNRLLG